MGVELLRFDMSEYMEKHTVSRLIGAPPGYVGFDQGGLLTDGIDQHPHSVLLLDEIEKAHPDLFNILLQVMDHGKLTDHNGKKIDFRNVVLIMTTNAGAADMATPADRLRPQQARGRRHGGDQPPVHAGVPQPARCGRSRFAGLPPEIILKVVEKFVLQLEAQLADRGVTIELTEDAARWLAEKGYDEKFGARPLARVIQEHIKKPLADELLFGKLEHGGTVRVLVAGEGAEKKLAFEYFPAEPKPKAKDGADEDDEDIDDDAEDGPGPGRGGPAQGPLRPQGQEGARQARRRPQRPAPQGRVGRNRAFARSAPSPPSTIRRADLRRRRCSAEPGRAAVAQRPKSAGPARGGEPGGACRRVAPLTGSARTGRGRGGSGRGGPCCTQALARHGSRGRRGRAPCAGSGLPGPRSSSGCAR